MPRLRRTHIQAEFQIAPMIDCVFLLLIYFIMTSSLKRQEADVSFQLPGTVAQSEPLEIPTETVIEIREDGTVVVNEYPYGNIADAELTALTTLLNRYREASDANRTAAPVTLAPGGQTPHSGIVKVMDACAKAGIQSVNFAINH